MWAMLATLAKLGYSASERAMLTLLCVFKNECKHFRVHKKQHIFRVFETSEVCNCNFRFRALAFQ